MFSELFVSHFTIKQSISHSKTVKSVQKCSDILFPTSLKKLRKSDNTPPHSSPWESDMKRRQPCQVQSSLIPCMLRRLNRAEAAGPPVCESTGFPEQRQWHPVFRLGARQWTFLYSWRAADSQNLTSCLPCMPHRRCASTEKRNPVFKVWALTASSVALLDDSLGAEWLTLRVLGVGGWKGGVGSWGIV